MQLRTKRKLERVKKMNFQTTKLRQLATQINELPSFWKNLVHQDAVAFESEGFCKDVAYEKALKGVLTDYNRPM